MGRTVKKAAWILAAAGAVIFSWPAAAQDSAPLQGTAQDNPFSALVGKRRVRRERQSTQGAIERYVLASDDRVFLFEDDGGEARIKFLCGSSDERLDCKLDPQGPTPEIYVLTATRAPRGDVIYKNVEGQTFLRIASYGGATVYWPGELQGLGASKSFGDNHSLSLASADRETALRRAQSATAIISATIGAPMIFDIDPLQNSNGVAASAFLADGATAVAGANANQNTDATVLADAVVTAAKGICAVADDPTGASVIAGRIVKISFFRDSAPGVVLKDRILEIHYVPQGDVFGRPSSAAVARFLEESL